MQPDSASATTMAMMGIENAPATRTGVIPQKRCPSFAPFMVKKQFSRTGRDRSRRGRAAPAPSRAMIGIRCLRRQRRPMSGADTDPDRTRHSRAAEPAIAGRILGQILLMIVLGEVERPG